MPPLELAGETQADLAGEAKPWVSMHVSNDELFSSVTASKFVLLGLSLPERKQLIQYEFKLEIKNDMNCFLTYTTHVDAGIGNDDVVDEIFQFCVGIQMDVVVVVVRFSFFVILLRFASCFANC